MADNLNQNNKNNGTISKKNKSYPNIILFFVDDLGYGDLGCYGGDQIPTPNIDKLAEHGVRFTDGYSTASMCSPARTGLLTGCYQQRFGYYQNWQPPAYGLPRQVPNLAEILKANGYRTAVYGKWHLSADEGNRPWERGFDDFYGFLSGAHDYYDANRGVNNNNDPIIRRGKEPVESITYLTDDITNEVCDFITKNQKRPFFTYIAYNAPHWPNQPPKRYQGKFDELSDHYKGRHSYAGMLAALDDGIGKIMAKLDELGLDNDTLVFFINDNGGENNGAINTPLRGMKGGFFEGGIRVPYIMRWSGKLKENTVYKNPVSTLDVLPTCLAAAGIDYPGKLQLDGVNLLPYINGKIKGIPHEILYWRGSYKAVGGGIRKGKYKLVDTRGFLRTQVSEKPDESYYYLYDLSSDLSECNDLSTCKPDICKKLIKEYEDWVDSMPSPLPQKNS